MPHGLPNTTEHSEAPAHALFKADHPREIDRHIAFFGYDEAPARDKCGEALPDALTGSGDADEVSS
jgi:hypothetical protein